MPTGEQPQGVTRASNRHAPSEPPAKSLPPSSNHGLILEDSPPGASAPGVAVREIVPGSAADAAGLSPGDVITEVAGRPVNGKADFDAAMAASDLKRGIMLMVNREGQRTFAILKP
jgi:S1-C subfamily serine protease